jgi:hypothetical protein
MKDSMVEKLIAQKINMLETGDESEPVGTEQLWKKLEKSLDKKATKKISLYRYWPVSAAAALLIALFIARLLPQQKTAVHTNIASSKPFDRNARITASKEPIAKTGELTNTAITSPKKNGVKKLKATEFIMKSDMDMTGAEDDSLIGMYATPVINELCYNTTVASSLACY